MLVHGSVGGYTNHGCRCPDCREAQRVYQSAYKALKRLKGLCVDCKEPAVEGMRRCQRHLDERKKYTGQYRHRVQRGRAA